MTSSVAGVVLIPSGSRVASYTLTWYSDNVTDTVASNLTVHFLEGFDMSYETANYSLEYYRYECDDLLEYLRVSDEQLDQWHEQQLEDVNAELQTVAA